VSTPTSLDLPTGIRRTAVRCARGTFAALEALPEAGAREFGTALLVPGYTGSKEDFLPILGALSDGGRRVLAIDQRGQYQTHGPDAPAAYLLAALAEDITALVQATGAKHLLGHSFGGLVTREAVLRGLRPASFTLMSSGPGALPGDRAEELRSFLASVTAVGEDGDGRDPEVLAARVGRMWDRGFRPQAIASGVPAPIVEFLQERMLATNPTGLVTMAWQLLSADDQTAALAATGIPAFVLYGENDDAWPTEAQEAMAAQLSARRECIPGAAHSPAVEAPATTAHALTEFWDATERASTERARARR